MQSALSFASWLMLGGLTGTATQLMLWRAVRGLHPRADGGIGVPAHVWGGYALRLIVVTGFLAWAAQRGSGQLLSAFLGLMFCRWAAIPWLSRRTVSDLRLVQWQD